MRIDLTKDTVTPELARILATAKRPRVLYQAGAKSMQKEISDHLRRLQNRGNVKGWPSQKFFAGKATSVERKVGIYLVDDKGAIVTIADPRFVHRIQGGVVTAKRGKYLAIPLTAEAYAKSGKGSIRESMPGLFVVKFPRGLYLCREEGEKRRNLDHGQSVAGKRTAAGRNKFHAQQRLRILPLFKLVRSVTHRPHPEEMPDVIQIGAAARRAMTQAAEILFKAGQS